MTDTLYHQATPALAGRRRELAPDIHHAFDEFSRAVFDYGALDRRTKQLIAVAVAHVTQCPYCIDVHVKRAKTAGASDEEVSESVFVAMAMRAGGSFAHSSVAMNCLSHQ